MPMSWSDILSFGAVPMLLVLGGLSLWVGLLEKDDKGSYQPRTKKLMSFTWVGGILLVLGIVLATIPYIMAFDIGTPANIRVDGVPSATLAQSTPLPTLTATTTPLEDIEPEKSRDRFPYWILIVFFLIFLWYINSRPPSDIKVIFGDKQNGDEVINVLIKNKSYQRAKCYAFVTKVLYNNEEDITARVTLYTNRLSWAGGSDEAVGIRYIDSRGGNGTINIAKKKRYDDLEFLMTAGRRRSGFDFGHYRVYLQIRGHFGTKQFNSPVRRQVDFDFVDTSEGNRVSSFLKLIEEEND